MQNKQSDSVHEQAANVRFTEALFNNCKKNSWCSEKLQNKKTAKSERLSSKEKVFFTMGVAKNL